jgi:hypothetical protein
VPALSDERSDLTRDHRVLACSDTKDGGTRRGAQDGVGIHLAIVSAELHLMQPGTDPGADQGRVLSDATGEGDRVDEIEGRRGRRDSGGGPPNEHVDGKSSPLLAAFLAGKELLHVGCAADAGKTRAMIEVRFDG